MLLFRSGPLGEEKDEEVINWLIRFPKLRRRYPVYLATRYLRPLAAYIVARWTTNLKVAIAHKVPLLRRGIGRGKHDIVFDGQELYEDSTSAELSSSGKDELRKILVETNPWGGIFLRRKMYGMVIEVRPVYAKGSDNSRLLAKGRAQNLKNEFGKLVHNAVFRETKAYKELYEAFPEDSERLIVIRQYKCLCCRLILPLLLILLICLGLHFLEPIARSGYSMFFDEFGKENFVVDVPANNQTVDICVRDYGCVDGDKISLFINSQEVFEGELFWENTCVSSGVNAGDNTIIMYAINGTGGKGNCPNNVNTGEISIGKLNWETRQWGLPPNTKKSATLQINVK